MTVQFIVNGVIFALITVSVGYFISILMSVSNFKVTCLIFLYEIKNVTDRKKRVAEVKKVLNTEFKKFAQNVVFAKTDSELMDILEIDTVEEVQNFVSKTHQLMSKKEIVKDKDTIKFMKFAGVYGYFQSVSTASIIYSDPDEVNKLLNSINRRKEEKKRKTKDKENFDKLFESFDNLRENQLVYRADELKGISSEKIIMFTPAFASNRNMRKHC